MVNWPRSWYKFHWLVGLLVFIFVCSKLKTSYLDTASTENSPHLEVNCYHHIRNSEGPHGLLAACWDVMCVCVPFPKIPSLRIQLSRQSYHTVHSKVVVLRLKLHCVRVAGPNLSVAVQKQALVVCDPVKHLPERKRQHESLQEEETN